MKKFFKALAVVLALTLVIGTIPASAAVDFTLKRNSKIIYIDGAKGTNGEKKCVTVNKYQLTKLFKTGFDAEVMDLKLESADKNIATTSNKYDRVYAQNIGKTTVKMTVFSLDTDKILDSEEVSIQVKKNATEDTFVVVSEDLVDGAKLGVNTEYTLKMPRVDAEGNWLDTDKRRLECDADSVVITATNKYATAYTVKFTEAGEFTLKASTFQSKKFPDTLLSKDIKVTVGFTAESVAQSALAKADVTFDSNVGKADKASFGAYYMIGDTQIPFSSVKEVAVKDNVVTVEFFTEFTANETYYITYENAAVGSFKAIEVKADSVAAVAVPDQDVVASTLADIKYSLLDANGIDITSKLGNGLNGSMSFTLVNPATDAFASGNQVYITKAGESYDLTAKYTWYVDGVEKFVEGTGKVTSKAAAVAQFAGVEGLVVKSGSANAVADSNVKPLANWTMSDAADLQIKVKYTLDGKDSFKSFLDGFKAEVADPSIIMLGSYDATNGAYALIANKEGTTTILVSELQADGNYKVIAAFPITVKAARKAAKLTVTADKNNLNNAFASDAVKFTVSLFDQYDEKLDGQAYTIDQVAGKEYALVNLAGGSTGTDLVLTPANITFTKAGAVTLKFICGDFNQTIGVSIADDANAQLQILKVSGNALDTGLKADTEAKTITVSLAGQTAGGYAAAGEAITFVAEAPKSQASTGSATYYNYTVSVDGKLLTAENANFAANTFTSIVGAASSAATKLAKGNYVVTAYKVAQNGTAQIVSVVGTSSFTVTDNQTQPEWKQTAEKVASLDAATIASAFEFKFNGNVVAPIAVDFTVDGAGSTAYVKSATVRVENATLGYVDFVINLGVLIKK